MKQQCIYVVFTFTNLIITTYSIWNSSSQEVVPHNHNITVNNEQLCEQHEVCAWPNVFQISHSGQNTFLMKYDPTVQFFITRLKHWITGIDQECNNNHCDFVSFETEDHWFIYYQISSIW